MFLALFLAVRADVHESAAGTEFYFAILDHWRGKDMSNNHQQVNVSISTIEATTVTFYIPNCNPANYTYTLPQDTAIIVPLRSEINPLEAVRITSTNPCFVKTWVHGYVCGSETAILPTELLGTRYMVQGAPGDLVNISYTPTQTHSEMMIIGTADTTTISVTAKEALLCVTRNQTVNAGQAVQFAIAAGEGLLFQPVDYTGSISGALVQSDKPVAVFQGNNMTQVPVGTKWGDYVWEQARPTNYWGKKFVIPLSPKFLANDYRITASEDNTIVYKYDNTGTIRTQKATLQAGETYYSAVFNQGDGSIESHIIETSRPACCYLYTTGATANNGVGDASMAEITPMDNRAVEYRWVMDYTLSNGPYTPLLMVTVDSTDEAYVKLNGQTLSAYRASYTGIRTAKAGYVIYQLPLLFSEEMVLHAEQGGFSAYALKIAKKSEASSFSVSIPSTPIEEPDLCRDGVLLYWEDFGGNDPRDPIVGTDSVPGMDYTTYYQHTDEGHEPRITSSFWLIKSGFYHGDTTGGKSPLQYPSQWYLQDDHTYPNDKTRGYMLEIDAMPGIAPFYTTVIHNLCSGTQLSFMAYIANVNKAYNYRHQIARDYPRLVFELEDAQSGTLLGSYNTGDIPYDSTLLGENDFFYSSKWYEHGLTFTVPVGVDSIRLTIYNDVTTIGAGNDLAIDDIQIRLCASPIRIISDDTVCVNENYSFRVDWEDNGAFGATLFYRWWYSPDDSTWTVLSDTIEPAFTTQLSDTGWYRVAVSAPGNIDCENCRVMSEPFWLTVLPGSQTDSVTIASICDYERYTWHGQTFNRDTTVVDTLINSVGCDSICTLRLHVIPSLYEDTATTMCRGETLIWHGQHLTTAGVYRDTVVGSNGCDSVIRLHLSLLEPTGSMTEVEACDRAAYQWHGRAFLTDTIVTDTLVNANGCDSLCVLQLQMLSTLRTDTALTVCDTLLPITWHGREIGRSGVYYDTLMSRLGCDSVVKLNVAVEVCYCDTLRAAATIGDVCADDDSLYIDLIYTDGLPAEYNVRFSSQAQQQGFPEEFGKPLSAQRNPFTLTAPIPHDPDNRQRYPRPDSYTMTLDVLDTCGVWRDWTLTFMVRYPSWLIMQKWDDVLALLNENYNGGYVFSAIRWYHEGEAITSRGAHDSYIYEKPTLSFGEAYWVELTRADDGVTIPSCSVYPSLNRQEREHPQSEEAERCRVYYIDGKLIAEYPLSTIQESLSHIPAGIYILIYYNKEGERIETQKRVQRYE